MSFDTKSWTCYFKGVFALTFQQNFSFLSWTAEDMKVSKTKRSIHKTFSLLSMGHLAFRTLFLVIQHIKKEINYQKIKENTTLQEQVQVFVSNYIPGHKDLTGLLKQAFNPPTPTPSPRENRGERGGFRGIFCGGWAFWNFRGEYNFLFPCIYILYYIS